jgi:hypothetical protein
MTNAPDITNVVVSNNDAGRITINGLPRLVEGCSSGSTSTRSSSA